jgi:uncharacterized membrane protein (UPF0127 family)
MICINPSPARPLICRPACGVGATVSAAGPAAPARGSRRLRAWASALQAGLRRAGGACTLALAGVLALGAAAPAAARDAPQPRLPTATLTVGMHRIVAELAVTPQQQTMGMMWRTEMGASEGMLFVNDSKEIRCFWMRNTLVPLTIAFLDDDGSIVNTADMQPRTDTTHCSTRPVRYALEMPQGWFERRGIKPGTRIRGGPLGN